MLRSQAPINVPNNAQIVGPLEKDGGYLQISYRWDESIGGRNNKFEVRWHEPTPNAPEGTQPNWRVTRTLSGTPDGVYKKEVFELIRGDNSSYIWVPQDEFRQATRAWANGTATPQQIDMLKRAHFE